MFSIFKKTGNKAVTEPTEELTQRYIMKKYGNFYLYRVPTKIIMTDGRTVDYMFSFSDYENYTNVYGIPTPVRKGFNHLTAHSKKFIAEVMEKGIFVNWVWYHPNSIKYIEFGTHTRELAGVWPHQELHTPTKI